MHFKLVRNVVMAALIGLFDAGTPTTHAPNACQPTTTKKLSVLTLATTSACIVWSVARGGVPDCLARWLRDAGVWRCDMHADELVRCLALEGVAAQGIVDLRELHSMVTPEAIEVCYCYCCIAWGRLHIFCFPQGPHFSA